MLDQTVTDVIVKSETKRNKRLRREMQEMAIASYVPPDVREELGSKLEKMGYDLEELEKDNPYNSTVEIADLLPVTVESPEEAVLRIIGKAGLVGKYAQVHQRIDSDGKNIRVEVLGTPDVTFNVPQLGEVKWLTFVGHPQDFADFLSKISVIETVSA